MSEKRKKTIHELRTTAQAKGIKFSFADDELALAQKITMVDDALKAKPPEPIARPEYDSRLRTAPVANECTEELATQMLIHHISRGLILTFPQPETWHMRCGNKEDTGNMRIPVRVLLDAADRVMR